MTFLFACTRSIRSYESRDDGIMASLGFTFDPIPDELAFGVIASAGAVIGCATYGEACVALFGRAPESPNSLVPRGFLKLMRSLCDRYQGNDPDVFIAERTRLPYYRHFANPNYVNGVYSAIQNDGPIPPNRLDARHRSSLEPYRYLQYCPDCASEQLAQYSRSTWLRAHNYPGVAFCYTHGCGLMKSTIPLESNGLIRTEPIAFPTPSPELPAQPRWNPGDCWERRSPSLVIAQVTYELATDHKSCGDKNAWYGAYRRRIGQLLNCPTHRPDWAGVRELLRRTYGDIVPYGLGLDLNGDSALRYIRLSLGNSNPNACYPAIHVLLIGALFDRYQDCKDAVLDQLHSIVSARETFQGAQDSEDLRQRRRSEILTHMKMHPSATRSKIRSAIGVCYNWLEVNDPEWLQENLPEKATSKTVRGHRRRRQKLDWDVLDDRAAAALDKIPKMPRSMPGARTRMPSLEILARQAGLRYGTLQKLKSLPRTRAALARIASSSSKTTATY